MTEAIILFIILFILSINIIRYIRTKDSNYIIEVILEIISIIILAIYLLITKEKMFWAYALFGAFHIAIYFIKIDHKIYDYIDIGVFFLAIIAWWRLKTQANSDKIQATSEGEI